MRLLVPLVLLLAACSPVATAVVTPPPATEKPVEMSASLYVVDAANTTQLSSARTTSQLEEIFSNMQSIWGQAGIELTLSSTARIEVPDTVLRDLAAGSTSSFFDAAAAGAIDIPDPGTLLGFYVKQIGSANGMTPLGTRVFFVADDPSVNDERVSSHEIGHILGLSHTRDDSARLMFSGTNGTDITREEATVTRYNATRILDGLG